MSNGKNDEAFARLFKLQATVGKLVMDGKRDPGEVADVLQRIVEQSDRGETLATVIAACRFDWVNQNIEKHFTLEPVHRERKVFHFVRSISSEDAVKKMEKDGWSPANLAELLDYAKNEWNGKDWIVALGSSARFDGDRYVPYLYRYDAGRGLNLSWWGNDWYGGCRFLASRN